MTKTKVIKESHSFHEFEKAMSDLRQRNEEFHSLISSLHYSMEALRHYYENGGKERLKAQNVDFRINHDIEIRIEPMGEPRPISKLKFSN